MMLILEVGDPRLREKLAAHVAWRQCSLHIKSGTTLVSARRISQLSCYWFANAGRCFQKPIFWTWSVSPQPPRRLGYVDTRYLGMWSSKDEHLLTSNSFRRVPQSREKHVYKFVRSTARQSAYCFFCEEYFAVKCIAKTLILWLCLLWIFLPLALQDYLHLVAIPYPLRTSCLMACRTTSLHSETGSKIRAKRSAEFSCHLQTGLRECEMVWVSNFWSVLGCSDQKLFSHFGLSKVVYVHHCRFDLNRQQDCCFSKTLALELWSFDQGPGDLVHLCLWWTEAIVDVDTSHHTVHATIIVDVSRYVSHRCSHPYRLPRPETQHLFKKIHRIQRKVCCRLARSCTHGWLNWM